LFLSQITQIFPFFLCRFKIIAYLCNVHMSKLLSYCSEDGYILVEKRLSDALFLAQRI
jgi:hypothetical protein